MKHKGCLTIKPRGFWATFGRFAAITALPFALLCSLLFYLMMDLEFESVLHLGIWYGIAFGLLFGFLMAFPFKAVTISETYQDKNAFLARLNIALAKIGYHTQSQTEIFTTYKPSIQAGLLSGKISVQIEDSSCTIVGPEIHIKKLKKQLKAEKPLEFKKALTEKIIPIKIVDSEGNNYRFASFSQRFIAHIIDYAILLIPMTITQLIIPVIFPALLALAYNVGFWSTRGATPGKMFMKLKVVDKNSNFITVEKGIIRYLGYIVSAVFILLGYFWILWDPNNQGWHDKFARSYVVVT
ncbi:MAG: RDD family protein [Candidatus Marinimicrobia bacterium]|nr:RDD family protein [Candidatus Neomarinimicrobiota bacterium]